MIFKELGTYHRDKIPINATLLDIDLCVLMVIYFNKSNKKSSKLIECLIINKNM